MNICARILPVAAAVVLLMGYGQNSYGDEQPPRISARAVRIDSVPSGASVYLIPHKIQSLEELRGEDSAEVFQRRHETLLQQQYLIGLTPITREIMPGSYTVSVSIAAEQLGKVGFPLPADPYFEDDGDWQQHFSRDKENGDLLRVTKVYTLDKKVDSHSTLVSVLIPGPDTRGSRAVPFLYPSLDAVKSLPLVYNPQRNEVLNAVRKTLAHPGIRDQVSDALIEELVPVLQKTGKAKIGLHGFSILVQMDHPASSEFQVQIIGYE